MPYTPPEIPAPNLTNETPALDTHRDHHNGLSDAVQVLSDVLGNNPAGAYSTVTEAVTALSAGAGSQYSASVVLYCPTLSEGNLNPEIGDMIHWVMFKPNYDGSGDGGAGLYGWETQHSFEYTGTWATDNDPTNVLLLLTGQWMPTIFAATTTTGWDAVTVPGGSLVSLSCGGGGPLGSPAVWYGLNTGTGDNEGNATVTTLPATMFVPTSVSATQVEVSTTESWQSLDWWINHEGHPVYHAAFMIEGTVDTNSPLLAQMSGEFDYQIQTEFDNQIPIYVFLVDYGGLWKFTDRNGTLAYEGNQPHNGNLIWAWRYFETVHNAHTGEGVLWGFFDDNTSICRLVPLTQIAAETGNDRVSALDLWRIPHGQAISFQSTPQETQSAATLQGWGFTITPDLAGSGFMVGSTGITRRYTGMGGTPANTVAVSTVNGLDTWAAPREVIAIADLPGSWDYQSGSSIVDLNNGTGLMFLHFEVQGGSYQHMELHCAKVVDDGTTVTITYLGPVVTTEMTQIEADDLSFSNNGIGSGSHVIWNDDVYVFFCDVDGSGVNRKYTTARCPRDDIFAAVGADTAPTFNKWNGEALDAPWTSLGLGGVSASSPSIAINSSVWNQGDFLRTPDNKILAVGTDFGGSNNMLVTTGDDPLTWSSPTVWDRYTGDPAGERIYVTLWSGDAAYPKEITGKHVYADTLYAPDSSSRWTNPYEVQKWELFPVAIPKQSPIQPATTYLLSEGTNLLQGLEGGLAIITQPESTVVLPPVTGESGSWEIISGSTGPVLVTADGPPINGTGDIILLPGEVGKFWSLGGGAGLWLGWKTDVQAKSVTYYDATVTGALTDRVVTLDRRDNDVVYTLPDVGWMDGVSISFTARDTGSRGSGTPLQIVTPADDYGVSLNTYDGCTWISSGGFWRVTSVYRD